MLLLFLPETLEETVLLRRAQRLRKLTGNDQIKAPSELGKNAHEGVGFVVKENIYRAIRLSAEPSILVANSYIALVYAIFYTVSEHTSLDSENGTDFFVLRTVV